MGVLLLAARRQGRSLSRAWWAGVAAPEGGTGAQEAAGARGLRAGARAQGRRPSPWAAGWARQRGAPQPSSAPTTPTDEEGPRSERTSPANSAARHSGVGALARGPLQLLLRRPAMR